MIIHQRRRFCINNIQTWSCNWKKKQDKATSTYLVIISFTFSIINQEIFFLSVKILLLKYIENHNVTKNCGLQKKWDIVNFMLPWNERLIAGERHKNILYCKYNNKIKYQCQFEYLRYQEGQDQIPGWETMGWH